MLKGEDLKNNVQNSILNGLDPLIAVQTVAVAALGSLPEEGRNIFNS